LFNFIKIFFWVGRGESHYWVVLEVTQGEEQILPLSQTGNQFIAIISSMTGQPLRKNRF